MGKKNNNLNFEIRRNCPGKYCEPNKYLTKWEKKMKKEIHYRIEREIKTKRDKEKEAMKGRRPIVIVTDFRKEYEDNKYREEKSESYEREYRVKYTLDILEKTGFDVEGFKKTWMATCNRAFMLIGCIQDIIDGFEYDEDGCRIPSKHGPIDINNLRCDYEKGTLTLTDGNLIYDIMIDEHQLIYINGVNVFKKDLNPVITSAEERKMIKELMDNMRSSRLAHERAMEKSLEYAKTWNVKD